MKKIYSILLTIAAAAFMAVSCQEEQAYEPGPQDMEGCYGVYFPVQEATGSHTYDPTMPTVQEFTVARKVSDDAIDVPYEINDPKGIFKCGPIHFDAGQTETTFEVEFPDAEMGVEYPLTIVITDNQYASYYGDCAIAFDFSAFRVEWKYFLNPAGEKAKLTFNETFWGETHTGYIKYYEVDGVRTCVTESDPTVYDDGSIAYGFWATGEKPGDGEFSFTWYTNVKCYGADGETTYQAIRVPEQKIWYHTSYGADVKFYDWYGYFTIVNPQSALEGMDFPTFCSKYSGSYPCSYYDGNGGFYFFAAYYYMIGIGGWGIEDYDPYCIADGFVRTDYSIEAETDYTVDGELPVYFTTGVDVKSVKFGAFEGELTATQIAAQVEAIYNDEAGAFSVADEFVYDEENKVNLFATSISDLPATGVYTIVAVSFDNDGLARESTSVLAKYVAAGDEEANAVNISLGIGTAEKYPGVNTETALETWAYGEDIVDAKIAVFKYIDLASSMEDCMDALMASTSVSEDVLAAINGDGYVSVVDKLLPGTEYYYMIWASNGYEQEFFLSSTSAKTSGDPLPIYQEYTIADLDESLLNPDPTSMAGKTFNYYGTDYFNTLGMNEYLGKVSISEVTKHISDPEYGDTNLVDVTGLYNYDDNDGVFDDVVEFDFSGGVLYHSSKTTKDGKANFYTMNAAGSAYNTTYFMGFVPVLDGYYAYVCLDASYFAQYGWCGFGYYAGGFWGFVTHAILVDPEKDDNGIAPANSAKLSSAVTMAINNALMHGQKGMYSKIGKSIKLYTDFNAVDGVCPANQVKITTRNIAPKTRESKSVDKNNITCTARDNIAF